MLTAKRVYLYGVLGVSLVLLLWGLSDLARFLFAEVAHAFSPGPVFAGSFAASELSRAVALLLVGGSIFGVHLALVRRSLRGGPDEVADERASASRATYFFLVLAGTGVALLWALFDFTYQLIAVATFGARDLQPAEPLGGVLVIGSAWLLHVLARRTDLRAAPGRTAGDWLTRAYLYGALFATFLIVALEAGDVLTTVARQVLDLRPAWESGRWWQEALASPAAATFVAAIGWLTHWLLANRLRRAPDPMGAAHRSARTRLGYFLAVVLTSAAAVLVLAATSLSNVLAGVLGTWSSTEGSRLIEDIGGPLLMLLPFAVAWWWHQRRTSREASVLGGLDLSRAVTRAARLVVALVGLAGLAAGLAWQLRLLFGAIGNDARESLFTASNFGDDSPLALGLALIGLVMWTPAWALSQRDRAQRATEAATATSRRAYLMLVSGLSVVAVMGALAYLVWQATRVLLESGHADDPAWAVAILIVAASVLAYHLIQLRSDLRVARVVEAGERDAAATVPPSLAVETIEISAPAGADFKVLNAAILSELPDGYQLRVLSAPGSEAR